MYFTRSVTVSGSYKDVLDRCKPHANDNNVYKTSRVNRTLFILFQIDKERMICSKLWGLRIFWIFSTLMGSFLGLMIWFYLHLSITFIPAVHVHCTLAVTVI